LLGEFPKVPFPPHFPRTSYEAVSVYFFVNVDTAGQIKIGAAMKRRTVPHPGVQLVVLLSTIFAIAGSPSEQEGAEPPPLVAFMGEE
jgi:hypothetical protein